MTSRFSLYVIQLEQKVSLIDAVFLKSYKKLINQFLHGLSVGKSNFFPFLYPNFHSTFADMDKKRKCHIDTASNKYLWHDKLAP
jgi:hypothetical protein